MVNPSASTQEARTVRKGTADELPRLAAVLARAFYDDPPVRWLLRDDERRMHMLERTFGLYLKNLWFPQDECYTTADVVGAAVWELPDRWQVGTIKQLQLFPAMAMIYGRTLPRMLGAITALESNHPKEPHYYLPFIGVVPEWQGKGVGSALFRPVLDRCDTERMPAYLEATAPENRALYERQGFVVTEEFHLGKGSPPLWRMWRQPAS
jgi:GNAT superfamily N-acetyltransferase